MQIGSGNISRPKKKMFFFWNKKKRETNQSHLVSSSFPLSLSLSIALF